MFYDNFLRLCNEINKSPSRVATEIGTTRSSVTRWKNGSMPTDATLVALADCFHVSVADLLKDEEKPAPINEDGLTQKHKLLIELFDLLTVSQQDFVIAQLQGLVQPR